MLMFLKDPIQKVPKWTKMSNFFQNAQNYGFLSFDFWFLNRGKKATINYCSCECKHNKMTKLKN